MTQEEWAKELRELPDKLVSITAVELEADENLHDRLREAILKFDIPGSVFLKIQDDLSYPPDWENMAKAVEVLNPDLLFANMRGWVAVGRWMDAPLARVHATGWLEPAFRRLSSVTQSMNIIPEENS
ncbi:MAG: hypothetical protein B7Z26_04915 [Asticcacaulis sp. 32-58-5]|nr:MAG: hypothetical protein B7Z26_04915 [Asticcacaulis sp. 32-58-5]